MSGLCVCGGDKCAKRARECQEWQEIGGHDSYLAKYYLAQIKVEIEVDLVKSFSLIQIHTSFNAYRCL